MTDAVRRDLAKPGEAPNEPHGDLLRFGDCDLRPSTRQLWLRGQLQPVRRKVFDLLLLLIDKRPNTVSHEQIASAVWGSKEISPARVARAVMEARRQIGDDPDAARYLLSVRGVGYRFAAELSHAPLPGETEVASAVTGAHEARLDIDAATARMRRGDLEEAQRYIDRAVMTADQAGAMPELGRAMAVASGVALRLGGRERALALATRAMRIAEQLGRDDLAARTHLAMADIHLTTGDAQAALVHLQPAFPALGSPGDVWMCESLLCLSHREAGQLDDAWSWSEKALASALRVDPQAGAVRERLFQVLLLDDKIEAAEYAERHADIQPLCQRALEILDAIESEETARNSTVYWVNCLSYRAGVLTRAGRFKEAWAVLERLRHALEGLNPVKLPWVEGRQWELEYFEARLLGMSGRSVEALERIEAMLSTRAQRRPDSFIELVSLHGLAALVCERAGDLRQALIWTRRQMLSAGKQQSQKSQYTSNAMRAQLEADRLTQELTDAQTRLERLEQRNRELEARMAEVERNALLDENGLVPAAALTATIESRLAEARDLELPFCVAVIQHIEDPALYNPASPHALRRRLGFIQGQLRAVFPEASAIAQWRPGCLFFAIGQTGLGRASERCRLLASRLNTEIMMLTSEGAKIKFSVEAFDATVGTCFHDAWERFLEPQSIQARS